MLILKPVAASCYGLTPLKITAFMCFLYVFLDTFCPVFLISQLMFNSQVQLGSWFQISSSRLRVLGSCMVFLESLP